MKEKGTAYLLWALSFLGVAGVHRLYLGRYVSGAVYMMTWGLLGIGTIVDAFALSRMVDQENMLEAARRHGLIPASPSTPMLPSVASSTAAPPASMSPPSPSGEKQILRLAAVQNGMVTPQQVALHTSLSLAEARAELGRLSAEGHCELDVGEDGTEQFRFPGLMPSSRTI